VDELIFDPELVCRSLIIDSHIQTNTQSHTHNHTHIHILTHTYMHTHTKVGFPVDELIFDRELVCRGLIIDKKLGNMVKVDRFGLVSARKRERQRNLM